MGGSGSTSTAACATGPRSPTGRTARPTPTRPTTGSPAPRRLPPMSSASSTPTPSTRLRRLCQVLHLPERDLPPRAGLRARAGLQRALQAVRRPRERPRVQRLLRIPGGRGPGQEEEEVERRLLLRHQSDPESRPQRIFFREKEIILLRCPLSRERRRKFGKNELISPPCNQSCQFINY